MTHSVPQTTRRPRPPRGPDAPHRGPAARGQRAAQSAASSRLASALARSRAWARPASTGARLAAYTIDVLACAVVGSVAGALLRSALIGGLVFVEAAVILLVLEARTGVTIGNLVLRQRTARDDAPFSPGAGRGFVRGLVLGAGSLVALVGGWVVVATSAADPMRMGRSWADRAGRTLVVKVPTRAEREAWARNAGEWALSAPAAEAREVPRQPARPAVAPPPGVPVPPGAPGQPGAPVPQGAPVQPGAPGIPQPHPAPPQPAAIPVPPQPAPQPAQPVAPPAADPAGIPAGVVTVDAPIAPPPPRREVGELLLLSFDTGQRAQLRIPAVANLGRRPGQTEAEDQLVAVEDPEGSVSKTHLRLEYRGDSVWVCDLGSTNGSGVVDDTGESVSLQPGARVRLDDGASVRIGRRSFTVAVVTGEL